MSEGICQGPQPQSCLEMADYDYIRATEFDF